MSCLSSTTHQMVDESRALHVAGSRLWRKSLIRVNLSRQQLHTLLNRCVVESRSFAMPGLLTRAHDVMCLPDSFGYRASGTSKSCRPLNYQMLKLD